MALCQSLQLTDLGTDLLDVIVEHLTPRDTLCLYEAHYDGDTPCDDGTNPGDEHSLAVLQACRSHLSFHFALSVLKHQCGQWCFGPRSSTRGDTTPYGLNRGEGAFQSMESDEFRFWCRVGQHGAMASDGLCVAVVKLSNLMLDRPHNGTYMNAASGNDHAHFIQQVWAAVPLVFHGMFAGPLAVMCYIEGFISTLLVLSDNETGIPSSSSRSHQDSRTGHAAVEELVNSVLLNPSAVTSFIASHPSMFETNLFFRPQHGLTIQLAEGVCLSKMALLLIVCSLRPRFTCIAITQASAGGFDGIVKRLLAVMGVEKNKRISSDIHKENDNNYTDRSLRWWMFLAQGQRGTWSPLRRACENGRSSTVELLLPLMFPDDAIAIRNEGAQLFCPSDENDSDVVTELRVLLKLACSSGDLQTVKVLSRFCIDADSRLNRRENEESTYPSSDFGPIVRFVFKHAPLALQNHHITLFLLTTFNRPWPSCPAADESTSGLIDGKPMPEDRHGSGESRLRTECTSHVVDPSHTDHIDLRLAARNGYHRTLQLLLSLPKCCGINVAKCFARNGSFVKPCREGNLSTVRVLLNAMKGDGWSLGDERSGAFWSWIKRESQPSPPDFCEGSIHHLQMQKSFHEHIKKELREGYIAACQSGHLFVARQLHDLVKWSNDEETMLMDMKETLTGVCRRGCPYLYTLLVLPKWRELLQSAEGSSWAVKQQLREIVLQTVQEACQRREIAMCSIVVSDAKQLGVRGCDLGRAVANACSTGNRALVHLLWRQFEGLKLSEECIEVIARSGSGASLTLVKEILQHLSSNKCQISLSSTRNKNVNSLLHSDGKPMEDQVLQECLDQMREKACRFFRSSSVDNSHDWKGIVKESQGMKKQFQEGDGAVQMMKWVADAVYRHLQSKKKNPDYQGPGCVVSYIMEKCPEFVELGQKNVSFGIHEGLLYAFREATLQGIQSVLRRPVFLNWLLMAVEAGYVKVVEYLLSLAQHDMDVDNLARRAALHGRSVCLIKLLEWKKRGSGPPIDPSIDEEFDRMFFGTVDLEDGVDRTYREALKALPTCQLDVDGAARRGDLGMLDFLMGGYECGKGNENVVGRGNHSTPSPNQLHLPPKISRHNIAKAFLDAVDEGRTDAVSMILCRTENTPSASAILETSTGALMCACARGNYGLVVQFLTMGYRRGATSDGERLIQWCFDAGGQGIASEEGEILPFVDLSSLPEDTRNELLVSACGSRSAQIVRLLLSFPDLDLHTSFRAKKPLSSNMEGTGRASTTLIDPTAHNNEAIRVACQNNALDVYKLLLSWRGPDGLRVDPTDCNNECVREVCSRGFVSLLELLLTWRGHGGNMVDPTANKSEALVEACRFHHFEVVKILLSLQRDCGVGGLENDASGPFYVFDKLPSENVQFGVIQSNTELIQILLASGRFDPFASDGSGVSAVSVAAHWVHGNAATQNLIRQHSPIRGSLYIAAGKMSGAIYKRFIGRYLMR